MAAVIALILGLAGCPEPPPSFACCGDEGGMASYPVPDPTRPITDAQRGTVREAIAAGALPADLDVDAVARSADRHARSPRFWSALEASADAYATVATLAVEAGREPMLAAVPFLLTGYALDLPSGECANGPWQLAVTDPRVVVGPCRLRDSTETWDRTSGPVPIDEAGCRLWGCEPDERLDLAASTRVALTQKDFPVDRGVAAGVHLLAVCALRARPEPPAFVTDTPGAWCGDVRPPPR